MASRPHRACLGGAGVSAPEGKRGALSAPTELVSVGRGLEDQKRTDGEPPRWCRSLRSTGASPVGARPCSRKVMHETNVQAPLIEEERGPSSSPCEGLCRATDLANLAGVSRRPAGAGGD